MPSSRNTVWLTAALILCCAASPAATISIGNLDSPPAIDGRDLEWGSLPETRVPMSLNRSDGRTKVSSVSIRGAVHGDRVYFCVTWEDDSEDTQHKPFEWNADQNKYVTGPQREDRLALQFAMSGDYSTDWLSGNEFVADMWHWKAGRTNPIGLAHDKRTVIERAAKKRAFKTKAGDGSDIYIQRPSDAGDKLYTTKRYKSREQDSMPKYIVNAQAKGSITDVQAKGAWRDGKWTVEFSRLLDTGNSDDAIFRTGAQIEGGIAVFDRSGDDDHVVSEVITYQF